MKNIKFSRLFAAMMFVAVLSFAGCKQQPEEKHYAIEGTWTSVENDGYTISNEKVVYDDGGFGFGWTRTLKEVTDSYFYTMDDNGKYYATAYKNLTDSSCQFTNAWKSGGLSFTDSLEEAKEEFTVENEYYGLWGTYIKQ